MYQLLLLVFCKAFIDSQIVATSYGLNAEHVIKSSAVCPYLSERVDNFPAQNPQQSPIGSLFTKCKVLVSTSPNTRPRSLSSLFLFCKCRPTSSNNNVLLQHSWTWLKPNYVLLVKHCIVALLYIGLSPTSSYQYQTSRDPFWPCLRASFPNHSSYCRIAISSDND